jgi:DNA-binding protein HU-beta
MTKTEFCDAVAEKAGLSKAAAAKAVDKALEVITDALVKGDKVTLIGFGTFEVRDRGARTGINPQTREPMKIAATKVPAFSAGAKLKGAVAATVKKAKTAKKAKAAKKKKKK